MFCPSCGKQVKKTVQFCSNCGNVIQTGLKNSTKGSEKPIIKESLMPISTEAENYRLRTDIASTEQAAGYLNGLKILFWAVFLNGVFINGLADSEDTLAFAGLLLIIHVLLLGYFIYYCAKILKALRLSRWNVLFCVFFAPLSWVYFYPLMADPLKIILGQKLPPSQIADDVRAKQKIASERDWLRFKIFVAVVVGLVILWTIFALMYWV